ncbi:hypothetical protein BJV85_001515 [Clostridium acetobutylicum]|uniref:hypothetical protein n=1 Tax=Clostridium TaxID=1485 RepID=UPI000200BDD3|nr:MULTISPECIES: hypothetical protein [Clostridium]ADZ21421.1 Conserved hypothetical protein [Clostridium acetobutylicum EA 2018]NOV88549.1 hypothetical protein [Clostridium acetobutylicum]NOW13107.1 hypothetical protein [Clostridium acetobutylicum]NRY55484.1 hypothetical protein [Clostridium acetobutylicum]NSA92669.1 hypothetical protein [Clostridium acetobutylicum]
MNYDVYTGILKMTDKFRKDNDCIRIRYIYDGKEAKELKDKYHIDEVAGRVNEENMAINLLNWLSDHVYHKGDYGNKYSVNNALDLLSYSYNKGSK